MNLNQLSQELAGMDPTELALGAGFIGIIVTLLAVGGIVWYFLSAIGYYKMYQKAGEAGWKAFIPYYRSYIRFKFAWNTKCFWIFFISTVIFQLFSESENLLLSLLGLAGGILFLVVSMKLDIRVAKSFGKSTGWGVLLFFFPFIVSLILGFGKAEYIGNTTVDTFIGANTPEQ